MIRSLIVFATLAVATLAAAPVVAQSEMRNPRAVGMGEAYAGGGNASGAIFHNPAGIITAGVYEGLAGWQLSGEPDGNAIGVQIVDSKTNPNVAAAASWSYVFANGDEDTRADDVRDHHFRGALAFPVVPQRLSLGLGARYTSVRTGWSLGSDGTENGGEAERAKPFTFDAGLMASLSRNFILGASFQNILQPDDAIEGRRYNAGVGVYFDALHVELAYAGEASLTSNETGHGVRAGLEYTLGPAPLRAGFSRDGLSEQNYVHGGIGYRSRTFGMDLALQQNVSGTAGDRLIMLSINGYM